MKGGALGDAGFTVLQRLCVLGQVTLSAPAARGVGVRPHWWQRGGEKAAGGAA